MPPTNLPRHRIVTEDLQTMLEANLPWHEFDGKTVLITGAAGMVASYLVQVLMYRNEIADKPLTRVVALVRNQNMAEFVFAHYTGRDDLEFLVQDVITPIQLDERVDFIIHAGSKASPLKFQVDPVGTHLANIVGTYNLLEFSRESPACKFLFVSSGEVYGDTSKLPNPITERDFGTLNPAAVHACYAESKRAGENLCVSWHHQFDRHTTIARLSHSYGPGMNEIDDRSFAVFVFRALAGKDLVLTSDGTPIRPFCYLTDACVGLLTVSLKGEPAQAYNVANDEGVVSIAKLADTICSLVPEHDIKVVYPSVESLKRPGLSVNLGSIPSTEKIRALGWKPTVGVEEGFRRTIASYR